MNKLEKQKRILVAIIRLNDRDGYNRLTLTVRVSGNFISYVCYIGWNSEGMGYSLSNFMMSDPLPLKSDAFQSTDGLIRRIRQSLASGYGSTTVSEVIKFNEL